MLYKALNAEIRIDRYEFYDFQIESLSNFSNYFAPSLPTRFAATTINLTHAEIPFSKQSSQRLKYPIFEKLFMKICQFSILSYSTFRIWKLGDKATSRYITGLTSECVWLNGTIGGQEHLFKSLVNSFLKASLCYNGIKC